MGFTGLTSAEYSSGERTRRGRLTKAGSHLPRTSLIEGAWVYRNRLVIGAGLRARQKNADPATLARSCRAQQRLCGKYHRMITAGKSPTATSTAIARELAGFTWAEMTDQPGKPG